MPTLKNLPVQNPHPNGQYFIDFLMGRTRGGRVPLVEYLVDDMVMRPVITELLGRPWVVEPYPIQSPADRELQKAALDNFIQFWYRMGYDFVRFERGMGFSGRSLAAADTAQDSHKDRNWSDEHHGMIANWDDFERYPWPKVENVDFFPYEYLSTHLPTSTDSFRSARLVSSRKIRKWLADGLATRDPFVFKSMPSPPVRGRLTSSSSPAGPDAILSSGLADSSRNTA